MMVWFAVALGGALGACLRYALSRLLEGASFPYAPLLANVSGSLMIGLLFVWVGGRLGTDHPVYVFLVVGILGGFTTFSTFSLDAIRLLDGGRYSAFFIYMSTTVILSLGAALLGLILARRLM